jgi:hypothetical protein
MSNSIMSPEQKTAINVVFGAMTIGKPGKFYYVKIQKLVAGRLIIRF